MKNDHITYLTELQHILDDSLVTFIKEEFELKYKNHIKLLPVLCERDKLISKYLGSQKFWEVSIYKYDAIHDILPIKYDSSVETISNPDTSVDAIIDCSFIKELKVFYEKEYWCCVEIHLNENQYVSNEKLTKKFNINSGEVVANEVVWKKCVVAGIFEFFESSVNEYEIFDVLYELYINAAYYFMGEL